MRLECGWDAFAATGDSSRSSSLTAAVPSTGTVCMLLCSLLATLPHRASASVFVPNTCFCPLAGQRGAGGPDPARPGQAKPSQAKPARHTPGRSFLATPPPCPTYTSSSCTTTKFYISSYDQSRARGVILGAPGSHVAALELIRGLDISRAPVSVWRVSDARRACMYVSIYLHGARRDGTSLLAKTPRLARLMERQRADGAHNGVP